MTTLQEMGIKNPQEIIGYSLFVVGNKDVLRINYKRKKGSLLPVAKRFSFPRQSKLVPSNGSQELINEISPLLSKAIDELDNLLKDKNNKSIKKVDLQDELNSLEFEMNSRIKTLKKMIESM